MSYRAWLYIDESFEHPQVSKPLSIGAFVLVK